MEWLFIAAGMALAVLGIIATMLVWRHREEVHAAAEEARSLNVISDDTRRAFWYSAADHDGPGDASGGSASSGGGDGGDSH